MKLSINYKHVDSHKPVEVEVERHVGKLQKLLKSYSPDLIQLHGGFSVNPRTQEVSCALTLSLPSGTLRATGEAAVVRTSCKKAFSDLEAQVKKHQEKLRKDYEWKRKRRPSTMTAAKSPCAQDARKASDTCAAPAGGQSGAASSAPSARSRRYACL